MAVEVVSARVRNQSSVWRKAISAGLGKACLIARLQVPDFRAYVARGGAFPPWSSRRNETPEYGLPASGARRGAAGAIPGAQRRLKSHEAALLLLEQRPLKSEQ